MSIVARNTVVVEMRSAEEIKLAKLRPHLDYVLERIAGRSNAVISQSYLDALVGLDIDVMILAKTVCTQSGIEVRS